MGNAPPVGEPSVPQDHVTLATRAIRLRDRALARGAAAIRGVAARRVALPTRGGRVDKVATRCIGGGGVLGSLIGFMAGGPMGALLGGALGTSGGTALGALLLAPGWLSATPSKPAQVVVPGSDVQLETFPDSPLLDAEFQRKLDADTHSRRTDGNGIRLLPVGVESFAVRRELMAGAKRSINLQTYIFHDDQTGRDTAQLLIDKAREGVAVRVIVDALGSMDSDGTLLDTMREAGVQVIEFNPPFSAIERLPYRWHQKILTVDDEAAVVGGMNVGSEYALHGSGTIDLTRGVGSASATWMRDTDVLERGPGVTDVVDTFRDNWYMQTGDFLADAVAAPPRPGGATTRFLAHHPQERHDTRIEDWYVAMLDRAEHTAHVTNAYFVPDERLVDAMVRAAKRGVDVRLLTNSIETSDSAVPAVPQAGRSRYDRLLEGGVRVFEAVDRGKVLRVLHEKTAVFDGVVSGVGSYNLDPRSANLNSEDLLEIQGDEVGAQMNYVFSNDLRRSREIHRSDLRDGTVLDRAEQWLFGSVLKSQL